jgi:Tol biopolymer transport system component
MKQPDDLDQMLAAWVDDPSVPPTSRILGRVLERTSRTRQRRSWASLERWLPMAVISRPAAAAPSLRIAWILLVALLAVALAVGGAIVASRLHLAAVAIPQGDAALIAYSAISDTPGQTAGDIYLSRADGSDVRQLTSGPAFDSSPNWSPDGTRIAFHRWEGGADSLIVMDGGGGNVVALARNEQDNRDCVSSLWATAWSPDGSSILFPTRRGCSGGGDLNIVAADGSAPPKKLLAGETASAFGAWSPDGRRIALLASETTGMTGLDLVDVGPDGGIAGGLTVRPIAPDIGPSLSNLQFSDEVEQPRWSPDGSDLAVASVTKGFFLEEADGVLIVKADGSGQRLLAPLGGNPAWSPDGQQIAFQRTVDPSEYANGRPCTVRTWLMDQDGSNERQLDELGDGCGTPEVWSPDGTRIASVLITPQAAGQDPLFRFGIVMVDGSSPPVILGDAYGSWQPIAAPLPPITSPSPS